MLGGGVCPKALARWRPASIACRKELSRHRGGCERRLAEKPAEDARRRRLRSALGEVIIEGIDTNVDYQYEILNHPDFVSGNIDIEFIEKM